MMILSKYYTHTQHYDSCGFVISDAAVYTSDFLLLAVWFLVFGFDKSISLDNRLQEFPGSVCNGM